MSKKKQKRKRDEKAWEAIAEEAQTYRDESIAKVSPPLPPDGDLPQRTIDIPRQVLASEDLEITELPAETLLHKLAYGELTATKVAEAFLRRAGLAQKLVCGCGSLV